MRENYLTAIKSRVANPVKFSAGRKYIKSANINAPTKVMAVLGYPIDDESMDSEDIVDSDIDGSPLTAPDSVATPNQAGGHKPESLSSDVPAATPKQAGGRNSGQIHEPTGAIRPESGSTESEFASPSGEMASPSGKILPSGKSRVSGGLMPSPPFVPSAEAGPETSVFHGSAGTSPPSHRPETNSRLVVSAEIHPAPVEMRESFSGGGKVSHEGVWVSGVQSEMATDVPESEYFGRNTKGPSSLSRSRGPKQRVKPPLPFVGDEEDDSSHPSSSSWQRKPVLSQVIVPQRTTLVQDPQELEDIHSEEGGHHKSRKRHKRKYSSSSDSDQHKRSKKRKTKESSSESESKRHKKKSKKHKRKAKPFLIEEEEGKVTMTKEGFASLVQNLMDARASTSSEEEAGNSIPGAWKHFRELLSDIHPDMPETHTPRTVFRSAAVQEELVTEQYKVPLFPGVKDSLDVCERSIAAFPTKEGTSSHPLGVGQLFPAPPKFPVKYWEAANGLAFTKPSSRPQNLPKDFFPRAPGEKETISGQNDLDLREEEKVSRELTSLWSIYRWSFSSLEALLESESLDEVKACLQTILTQQQLMVPYVEERLLHQLTNTMLKRRDAYLRTKEAQKMQESTVTKLRSSSLIGPELMSIPKDIISEEQEIKSTRGFWSKVLYGSKAWLPQQTFTRQVPRVPRPNVVRAPSAAAGSAAQMASMPPVLEPQWSQPTSTFRPRRPQGQFQRGRGSHRGTATLEFKSGPSARGRRPFRGRGRKQ